MELNVLVLDLETLKNPNEVGGWDNCQQMGVSVLGLKPIIVGCEGIASQKSVNIITDPIVNQKQIIIDQINSADIIVSHNGLSFDYKVLMGTLDFSSDWIKTNLFPKTIDFLHQIKIRHKIRVSLSNVATRTIGLKHTKELPGEDVIAYWRSGDEAKREKVIKHCIDDVEWTAEIFCKMYDQTKWAKKIPTGRITFYNAEAAEARKNGIETRCRIISNCVISYPKKMQEFLIELKNNVKNKKKHNI